MSVGRSKKSSTSSTEGSPTEFQSRLRAPDNFNSPLPANRSVSFSNLNYLAQSASAEPIAPGSSSTKSNQKPSDQAAKEKRDRKRSFRLSASSIGSSSEGGGLSLGGGGGSSSGSSNSSPGRFVRGMKRVSSAFKSGHSSSASTSESKSEGGSDTDSRRSASVASSVASASPPLNSAPFPLQPPETPKAATTSSGPPPATASPASEPGLGASSFLVLNPNPEHSISQPEEPPSQAPQLPDLSTSPAAGATPLAEQPPFSMQAAAAAASSPQRTTPPASVGFPEVDQIGDAEPEVPEEQPAAAQDQQQSSSFAPAAAPSEDAPPASVDYPPVDVLVKEREAQERAIQQMATTDSSEDDEDEDDGHQREEEEEAGAHAATKQDAKPSHSLTLSAWRALLNPDTYTMTVSTRRKMYLVLGSLAINLLLPFVNGVMLGLGEIFARESIAIYFGLGPKASTAAGPRPAKANVGQVGLRAAGESGGGNPKPGKPAAKTAAEMAEEAVRRV